MAGKLSQLRADAPAQPFTGAEIFEVTQGGDSRGAIASQLRDYILGLLVAGTNVSLNVDQSTGAVTISAAGGGSGGAVDSVNTRTGAVVLTAADTPAGVSSTSATAENLEASNAGSYRVFTASPAKTTPRSPLTCGVSSSGVARTYRVGPHEMHKKPSASMTAQRASVVFRPSR